MTGTLHRRPAPQIPGRSRREFSVAVQLAIIKRATDPSGRILCESCRAWCKTRAHYEIDHIISEGIRPAADRKRKLTPADGQLLCVAVCHKRKTRNDVGDIGQAKRREAAALGIERPGKVEIPHKEKAGKKPLRTAPGPPGMMRRYK
jgi:hypothetical protein